MKPSPFERAALAHANSRGSDGTKWLYAKDVERWVVFCAEHKTNPSKPTIETATAFRDELAAGQKPATVRRTLMALSRMYRAAVNARPRAADWNPFDADALTRPPPSTFGKTQALTDEQAQAIIAEAAKDKDFGVRDVAILQVLYTTGARISSVVNLRHDKLFRHGKTLVARVPAKKKDEVDIELSATAAAALEDWMMLAPKSEYVFPAPKNPRVAVPRRTFYKRLVKYGRAVGIMKVHPHRFRATFATEALNAGVPLHDVQAALHHASPMTTQRYDRGIRGAGVVAAVAAFREKKEK